MREQSFEMHLERVLRTEADLAVRPFDAWGIANGAASTRRTIGGWRAVRLLAAAVALLGLLVGAALLAGSLIDRSPAPLSVVLVARPDGLFAGDPSISPLDSIVGNRQVVDVERSPSGRYAATLGTFADIVPLDGGAAPAHGQSGSLLALESSRVFDFPDRDAGGATAIAWAPVPLGGRELLAVLSAFNGFVVLDATGQVVVDHPQSADVAVAAGVAWSIDAETGTLGLTWTSGRDIWRTTIQPTGESSTRLIVRLTEVEGAVSQSRGGRYIGRLAASADGRHIAATLSPCFACPVNLWLVDESGAATLMTDRVADDGWLSFSPDGQHVLALVNGPSGSPGASLVALPIAAGPGSPIDTDSITAGAGRVYGRWLSDGRILVAWWAPRVPADPDTNRVPLQFWVTGPDGRFERVATDAFDVDLAR